jgi:hypothetical protein
MMQPQQAQRSVGEVIVPRSAVGIIIGKGGGKLSTEIIPTNFSQFFRDH